MREATITLRCCARCQRRNAPGLEVSGAWASGTGRNAVVVGGKSRIASARPDGIRPLHVVQGARRQGAGAKAYWKSVERRQHGQRAGWAARSGRRSSGRALVEGRWRHRRGANEIHPDRDLLPWTDARPALDVGRGRRDRLPARRSRHLPRGRQPVVRSRAGGHHLRSGARGLGARPAVRRLPRPGGRPHRVPLRRRRSPRARSRQPAGRARRVRRPLVAAPARLCPARLAGASAGAGRPRGGVARGHPGGAAGPRGVGARRGRR